MIQQFHFCLFTKRLKKKNTNSKRYVHLMYVALFTIAKVCIQAKYTWIDEYRKCDSTPKSNKILYVSYISLKIKKIIIS